MSRIILAGSLVVLYPILSQMCKRFFKHFSLAFSVSFHFYISTYNNVIIFSWQALYSVVVTMYLIGVFPTLYLFLQIVVMWAAYQTNSAK